MKNLFSAGLRDSNVSFGLLLLRLGIGVLMLVHGLPKMGSLLSSEPVSFPSVFGMDATMSLGLAVFAEVGCSILLIAGFGTRIATVPLIITMLVAVLYIHGSDPFAKQEMGIHYLLGYIVLVVTGPGKYPADYMISKRLLVNRVPAYSRY